jgi:hypothetical protein
MNFAIVSHRIYVPVQADDALFVAAPFARSALFGAVAHIAFPGWTPPEAG